MSKHKRDARRSEVATGSKAEPIAEIDSPERVSTGGHMDPTVQGELPSDRHGAGTAERNRDRDAGLGEGLPHAETMGGRESSARAGRQILNAVEERAPSTDRGDRDRS